MSRTARSPGRPRGEAPRTAEWIEALGRPEDHAELVAYHWRSALDLVRASGGDDTTVGERTRLALRDAGDRAVALNSYSVAAAQYEDALALWPPKPKTGRAPVPLGPGPSNAYDERREDALEQARDALARGGRDATRGRGGGIPALHAGTEERQEHTCAPRVGRGARGRLGLAIGGASARRLCADACDRRGHRRGETTSPRPRSRWPRRWTPGAPGARAGDGRHDETRHGDPPGFEDKRRRSRSRSSSTRRLLVHREQPRGRRHPGRGHTARGRALPEALRLGERFGDKQ